VSKKKRQIIPLEKLYGNVLAESATEGTDLSCALTNAAYIENALGSLLTSVLIKEETSEGLLNDPFGILGSASARANMCYCLGLIDEGTHENAKKIAKIRNLFAHSHVPIDFGQDDVTKLCKELKPPVLVDPQKNKVLNQHESAKLLSTARQTFVASSIGTFLAIEAAAWNRKPETPRKISAQCTVSASQGSIVGGAVLLLK
jgi:DNA-binding MltR family transcriptional regulator